MKPLGEILAPALVDAVRSAETPVELTTALIGAIPKLACLHSVEIEKRGRYATRGVIDYCVIHTSRSDAVALGIWIAGSSLDPAHESCELQVSNGEFAIRLIFDKDDDPALRYVTDPSRDLEQWVTELPQDTTRPNMGFVNDDDGYGSLVDWGALWDARNVVEVTGTRAALLLIAEFLLAFGHNGCTLNYEYLKDVDQVLGLTDSRSCEGRVQIDEP